MGSQKFLNKRSQSIDIEMKEISKKLCPKNVSLFPFLCREEYIDKYKNLRQSTDGIIDFQ